jgi:hypothetical protein
MFLVLVGGVLAGATSSRSEQARQEAESREQRAESKTEKSESGPDKKQRAECRGQRSKKRAGSREGREQRQSAFCKVEEQCYTNGLQWYTYVE